MDTSLNAAEEPTLKIYNSLTRSKTPFIPQSGRNVKWYNCGPTVYDASHMGHARNYVTQDYIHRILTDYFGYDVHFVMNITDIDDKSGKAGFPMLVLSLADSDTTWRASCVTKDEKFGMHLSALHTAYDALQTASARLSAGGLSETDSQAEAYKLIDASRDILALPLDAEYGHSITDPSIPREHAAYWEADFMKDMKRLRVLPPDTLTRVTEYLEKIVDFVKKLIEQGFAYELDGSVYFDTRVYDGAARHETNGEVASWCHTYLKLEPWSKGNRAALTQSFSRYDADFALWKASKPGEPSWPSPWGAGRPGWYIGCSVMASEVFGETMDIHSGGSDPAFPHHDNEIAQSKNFFTVVKAFVSQAPANKNYPNRYKAPERELAAALVKAQGDYRAALCDSFNTPQAIIVLRDLVSQANIYITQASGKPNVGVIESVARWIGKMLRILGLEEGPHWLMVVLAGVKVLPMAKVLQ
ncbi:hypothetical protein M422DRAFT_781445 [Sphaerobolus stellatus SS14]|uniref:Cysteinyl-tRNA synthetase class Ia DALR domain-containing protein n=1 Tax=Sphaerobolus stellatus (strain SS14) TaxID=990650 RepID=A0A0C9VLR1_SPHS4|nr:hypothetical protein M422DRAFT_781445 [Sphaerobolus stellatus SS14]